MGDDGWDAERDRLLRAIEERVMTDPHGLDAAEQILRDALTPAARSSTRTLPIGGRLMGDDGWDDRPLQRLFADPGRYGRRLVEHLAADRPAQLTPPWLVEHLAAKHREREAAFRAAHPWRARWREHVGWRCAGLRSRLIDAWSVLRHGGLDP